MKSKVLLIIAILAISWQTAFSQFETVWDKKLPNNIKTVSFSHDSKWLMAWISPNSIIFNTELGELVNDKIPASINYPSFSNDDSHIFGINDNRIIHYNIKTGKDDSIFEPSNYPITEYVITKNEQFIIGLIIHHH